MTDALAEGNLQPSAAAAKLVESLEGRLNRRDLETKHKATRHFFESLKTENEKLFIKNEFDHSAIYEKLPPHEKDWIYNRASLQKENLEYKLAYERGKSAGRTSSPQNQAIQRMKILSAFDRNLPPEHSGIKRRFWRTEKKRKILNAARRTKSCCKQSVF